VLERDPISRGGWRGAGLTRGWRVMDYLRLKVALKRVRWPLMAVAVVVGVSLSDWPFGWAFWVDHPLVAAVVAGLLVLLVAGAAVDAYIRAREAKRWRSVGRAAAAELSHIFDQATLAMLALLGFDEGPAREEIEYALRPVRKKVSELLAPPRADGIDLLWRQRDPADPGDDEWQRERLTVLVQNREWIRGCHAVMVACSRLQLETISRWVATFAILSDDDQVTRIDGAMRLIERTRALDTKLLAEGREPAARQVSEALDDWAALLAGFRREANYWYRRYQADAETRDEGQRMEEAERDGVIEAAAIKDERALRSPR
jgi:hypothetical protein